MGLVICATEMEIEQTWNPNSTLRIKAGEVIVRIIKRTAVGTTAMMLPEVPDSAPDGMQVYARTPDVEDKVERGDSRALRTDTTKYQFQQAGSFTLPERVFLWWDRQQEELQRKTLPGLTIAVAEASVAVSSAREPEPERSPIWMFAAVGLLALGLFAWLIRNPVLRWIEAWRAHHIRPLALAARNLRSACQSHDVSALPPLNPRAVSAARFE